MRYRDYTDERGRKYKVILPPNAPDEDVELGIPVGPPDIVDAIGYPEPFATRLHNALFDHELWTIRDIRKNPKILQSLLMRVLKVDIQILMDAMRETERN